MAWKQGFAKEPALVRVGRTRRVFCEARLVIQLVNEEDANLWTPKESVELCSWDELAMQLELSFRGS